MKFLLRVFTVCIILSFTNELKAQAPEGMKYQAVARDGSGNVMANGSMTVRIGIYQAAGAATKVYEETQNITTNQFGLFNLNIGEGSATFGTFNNIDWGSDEHHLKVEINTGSGFVDMGTNQLQSVPYSLFAKEAGSVSNMDIAQLTDVNIAGVSNNQILKWDGSNWVPGNDEGMTSVNTDATLDGDGSSGNDLKIAQQGANNGEVLKWDGSTWVPATDNSGGSYNAGTGISISGNTITNTDPDQTVNLTGGGATSVSGTYPNFTISSTDNNTTYSGGTGIDLNGTSFEAENTTPMWNADQLQGNDVSAAAPSLGDILRWNGSEWMPQVNTDTNHWHKNSNKVYTVIDSVGIGTADPLERLHVNTGGNVLFGDTSIPTGFLVAEPRFLWASDNGALRAGEVRGSNWRPDSLANASVAFGWNSEASALAAFAAGFATEASGSSSTALGFSSTASGSSSTALGNSTTASGNRSTAMGDNTTASGSNSTAMGDNTIAAGYRSTAMGYATTASSSYETVVGRFNTNYTPHDSIGWYFGDRLFSIGNGTSSGAGRSDAVVVLKNGNVGIGTSTPSATFEVDGDSSIFTTGSYDFISIKQEGIEPAIIPHGNLSDNGYLGISSFPFYKVYSTNFYASSSSSYKTFSDSRIKENIKPLDHTLDKIKAIKGVSYDITESHYSRNGEPRDEDGRYNQIGLLAQDVEKVFPQFVDTDEKTGLKSVGYMGLIPVIVEGMKEQQNIIEKQREENQELKVRVESLEQRLLQMEESMQQLKGK